MPTQNIKLDNNWVDVKALLGLADNTNYSFQCTGAFELRVFEGANEPEPEEYGHQLENNDWLKVEPQLGQNIYARCTAKNLTTNLTVSEC